MTSYADIVKTLAPTESGLTCPIPDGWRQGRTAYGGVTAALSLEAAQRSFDNLPPLRSAQINFIGPVSSDPVFTSRLLRQGKNVSSIRTEGHVDGGCISSSVFIFGAPRDSTVSAELRAPASPAPEDCEDFAPQSFRKFLPAFIHNFDVKFAAGHRPASGADEGYIRAWARHTDPASQDGLPSLLCIGDILPPAAAATFKQMGPISSINWMMNILAEPETRDGWWHIESRQTGAGEGYSSQVMRFWNTDGDLVAEGMQSVAVFL